jgi:hypothetical protein
MPPLSPSGHFQRQIDKVLNLKERNHILYDLDMPGHAKYSASREVSSIHIIPPSELVVDEVFKNPTVAHKLHEPHAVWRTDHYTEHASKSEIPLYPMALYLDGVVFQKRDSTLGFWLYNLLTGTRQLFAVLKKSQLCKCGCRGWCTLYNVFSFLRWDLEHLLKGVSASSRHDGGPWRASDEKRQASAGMIMLMRGLVLFVKGDWAEFAHSLGFRTWSHKTWPCIFCFASLLQLSTIQGFNPMEFPFELFDQAKYEDACALCEILVTIITEAMKKQNCVPVGVRQKEEDWSFPW